MVGFLSHLKKEDSCKHEDGDNGHPDCHLKYIQIYLYIDTNISKYKNIDRNISKLDSSKLCEFCIFCMFF